MADKEVDAVASGVAADAVSLAVDEEVAASGVAVAVKDWLHIGSSDPRKHHER